MRKIIVRNRTPRKAARTLITMVESRATEDTSLVEEVVDLMADAKGVGELEDDVGGKEMVASVLEVLSRWGKMKK